MVITPSPSSDDLTVAKESEEQLLMNLKLNGTLGEPDTSLDITGENNTKEQRGKQDLRYSVLFLNLLLILSAGCLLYLIGSYGKGRKNRVSRFWWRVSNRWELYCTITPDPKQIKVQK